MELSVKQFNRISVFILLTSLGCQQSTDVSTPKPTTVQIVSQVGNSTSAEIQIGAAQFHSTGELLRPTDYRKWVFIGSTVTPHDLNNGRAAFPEFHNVYIDPESYDAYMTTGQFRDGTVIIKDLVSVGGKRALSGNGYFQGEFLGLEAMVKTKRYAKDEPGHWNFYSFTTKKDQPPISKTVAQPAANCSSCHAAAKDDYVFSEWYPVLRTAKK